MLNNFQKKNFSIKKNEIDLLKFLRANTNMNSGGNKLYDGLGLTLFKIQKNLFGQLKKFKKLQKTKNLRIKIFLNLDMLMVSLTQF